MECPYTSIFSWPTYQKNGLSVILASTPCRKMQGLQHQHRLPRETIVVFPQVSPGEFFHTNNCFIAMDIIALNSLNMVLKVWTVAPGASKIGPMPPGTSRVAEAAAGWCQSKALNIGSILPL